MRKTCTKCGVEKDLREFYRNRKKKGRQARSSQCILCVRVRHLAYSRQHYEDRRDYMKRWRAKNKARIKRASAKSFRRKTSTLTGYLIHCAKRKLSECRRKNIRCDFTDTSLIVLYQRQKGRCAISGRTLQWKGGRSLDTLSIDRIDPKGGYTMDNVRLVTALANVARSHFNDGVLIAFANGVSETARKRGMSGMQNLMPPGRINLAELFNETADAFRAIGIKNVTFIRLMDPPDSLQVLLTGIDLQQLARSKAPLPGDPLPEPQSDVPCEDPESSMDEEEKKR